MPIRNLLAFWVKFNDLYLQMKKKNFAFYNSSVQKKLPVLDLITASKDGCKISRRNYYGGSRGFSGDRKLLQKIR